MFVPDCYKNQKCAINLLIIIVADYYKTQKMCNSVVDIYTFAIQFVPECFETQEICVETIDTCSFVFDSVPD